MPEFPSEPLRCYFVALVGGGTAGLNPALVFVDARPDRDFSSLVTVRAVAKEGLVKQQTAQRVVQRLTGLFQDVT